MLRVEVIEPSGFMEGSIKRNNGDVFSSDLGQYYVDLGWCRDVETGEAGKRTEGINKLTPKNIKTVIK